MASAPAKFAWLDGEFVPWADAKIHIRSECVIRGISVFEGLRGYWSESKKQMYVFRSPDHFKRLEASNTAIDCYRERHAIRSRVFEGRYIETVTFVEPIGNVKNTLAAESTDHAPQQRRARCTIDVVIAPDEDLFVSIYRF